MYDIFRKINSLCRCVQQHQMRREYKPGVLELIQQLVGTHSYNEAVNCNLPGPESHFTGSGMSRNHDSREQGALLIYSRP